MSNINWIIDNPYDQKFTATRVSTSTTTDITPSQAKVMIAEEGVWASAKARCNLRAVSCKPVESFKKEILEYCTPLSQRYDW